MTMPDLTKSVRKHLAEIGAKGGAAKSTAKSKAAATNGKKGGRPKKAKGSASSSA